MRRKILLPGLVALALGMAGSLGLAQIKRFTLDEMIAATDNTVFGEIVAQRVFRVDHAIDGPELYFTTLTIEGHSLNDDTPLTVDVTYHGGFINEEEGVYNSEAPSADDVKLGNRVVVFYEWTDNMGGGVAANALVASHGGLFRSLDGPSGATVLGRGDGYAVDRNVKLADLKHAVSKLHKAKKNEKGKEEKAK